MAIAYDDIGEKDFWATLSRHWYTLALRRQPNVGRLYHHLATVTRPDAVQQLLYYTKSLCVPHPFGLARESIFTLPVFNGQQAGLCELDVEFLGAHHEILCSRRGYDNISYDMDALLRALGASIAVCESIPCMEKL